MGNVESSHTTRPSHIPTAIIQGHTNEDVINLSGPENCLDNGVHLGARRAFSPVAPQDAPPGAAQRLWRGLPTKSVSPGSFTRQTPHKRRASGRIAPSQLRLVE